MGGPAAKPPGRRSAARPGRPPCGGAANRHRRGDPFGDIPPALRGAAHERTHPGADRCRGVTRPQQSARPCSSDRRTPAQPSRGPSQPSRAASWARVQPCGAAACGASSPSVAGCTCASRPLHVFSHSRHARSQVAQWGWCSLCSAHESAHVLHAWMQACAAPRASDARHKRCGATGPARSSRTHRHSRGHRGCNASWRRHPSRTGTHPRSRARLSTSTGRFDGVDEQVTVHRDVGGIVLEQLAGQHGAS